MKQQTKDFLENLLFIFMPSYWLMMVPYNKEWDTQMKIWLEQDVEMKILTDCRMSINGKEIWIANHPYNSFCPYMLDFRPSRLTIKRWAKKVKELKHEFKYRELRNFINS